MSTLASGLALLIATQMKNIQQQSLPATLLCLELFSETVGRE